MVPLTFVPNTKSISASDIVASLESGKIPAFAQSTSMPPLRSIAVLATMSQSALLLTSASTYVTVPPPKAVSSAQADLALASSRPVIRTFAPAFAKTRAIPLPMPFVPPVTTTEYPLTEVNMFSPSFLTSCRRFLTIMQTLTDSFRPIRNLLW